MARKFGLIVDAVNRIIGEYDYPLTLRQIYYRLVASNIIPNKRSSYNQLSKTLVKAREMNVVDDTKIEDRAREVLKAPEGWASPDVFVDSITDGIKRLGSVYRRDLWSDQDFYIEVWVEKDALSRVLSRAIEDYRVTVCPSRGYSSYTYIKRMAVEERFASIEKQILILDFRDHDPSGIQMTEDLETRFNKYGGDKDIRVERIALTIDQVKEHDLLPNPTKMADPRSPKYVEEFGDECWELDAIEPNELQAIVRGAVSGYIDSERWDESLEEETKEREVMTKRFSNAKIEV
jgi:hypothetical protein